MDIFEKKNNNKKMVFEDDELNYVKDYAVAIIISVIFYYFIVRNDFHIMTILEAMWYRIIKTLYDNKKNKKNKKQWELVYDQSNFDDIKLKWNSLWFPDPGVFGIVWIILYLIIAIAFYLVWLQMWFNTTQLKDDSEEFKTRLNYQLWAFGILFFNIFANKIWIMIFFSGKQMLFSAILIVFMFITLIPIIVLLYLSELPLPASLLIPYGLWLIYAFILNMIFYLNQKVFIRIWNQLCVEEKQFKSISYVSLSSKEKEDLIEQIRILKYANGSDMTISKRVKKNKSKKI